MGTVKWSNKVQRFSINQFYDIKKEARIHELLIKTYYFFKSSDYLRYYLHDLVVATAATGGTFGFFLQTIKLLFNVFEFISLV